MPSKHLLVLKTSWRRLQNMSWTHLQNVFSVTIFCLPIRLEDALKTSWKTKNCYAEDMSWRRLQDVLETKCLLRISLSNKSNFESDKSISHISISDKSRRIQNPLIRTQQFQYSSYLETQAFLFWELKSLTTVWLLWNQVKSNSTLQNRWGNKNEVLGNMLDKYI